MIYIPEGWSSAHIDIGETVAVTQHRTVPAAKFRSDTDEVLVLGRCLGLLGFFIKLPQHMLTCNDGFTDDTTAMPHIKRLYLSRLQKNHENH